MFVSFTYGISVWDYAVQYVRETYFYVAYRFDFNNITGDKVIDILIKFYRDRTSIFLALVGNLLSQRDSQFLCLKKLGLKMIIYYSCESYINSIYLNR